MAGGRGRVLVLFAGQGEQREECFVMLRGVWTELGDWAEQQGGCLGVGSLCLGRGRKITDCCFTPVTEIAQGETAMLQCHHQSSW